MHDLKKLIFLDEYCILELQGEESAPKEGGVGCVIKEKVSVIQNTEEKKID